MRVAHTTHKHTNSTMRILLLGFSMLLCGLLVPHKVYAQTDVAYSANDHRLLFFITIDGTLVAVDEHTWTIRWQMKDKPIVEVPLNTSDAIFPMYLPDPRDGSLYLIGDEKAPLKKAPFTVQQLVAASPCKSTDGILYTGKKEDSWIRLDAHSGNILQTVGWDTNFKVTCPKPHIQSVQIGRTKYSVMMVDDIDPKKQWNVTYYDYTTHSITSAGSRGRGSSSSNGGGDAGKPSYKNHNQDLTFFTSSSTGRLLVLNHHGRLLWDGDLNSPIVGAYILEGTGMRAVHFTSVANNTLENFALKLYQTPHSEEALINTDLNFYSTVYIGDHLHGWYAIPALVDSDAIGVASIKELLPRNVHAVNGGDTDSNQAVAASEVCMSPSVLLRGDGGSTMLTGGGVVRKTFVGHYFFGDHLDVDLRNRQLDGPQLKLLTDESSSHHRGAPSTIISQATASTIAGNLSHTVIHSVRDWIHGQENKGLIAVLVVLFGVVMAMFWYLHRQVNELHNISRENSRTGNNQQRQSAVGDDDGGCNDDAVPRPQAQLPAKSIKLEELTDGRLRIGNISFHPSQVLGRGCEGTVVYRGEFDRRRVAVKRIVPEYVTYADREVALLRESDAHPNVVRYYCMEEDRMFRYIALEMCQATVHDYVAGVFPPPNTAVTIAACEVMRQATVGLSHLHSLDIVHRDIKPQNVLLSISSGANSKVRVMISDFGMCRKLPVGRMSFSRRSGVTGTEGWIAPEMYNDTERTTCAVDLFSLGCLFYYVLSNGKHPFGKELQRQANIAKGEYCLNGLATAEHDGDLWRSCVQRTLIAAMIAVDPAERPSCWAVLQHPIFWENTRILAFFQDVSDRLELADNGDALLKSLETGAATVLHANWRLHIDDEIANDIKKYRTYNGDSVRDLLRALRNKKHHYRELTDKARRLLGEIPDAFTVYWTSRFPLLFVHTWLRMQCIAAEPTFQQYYPPNAYRYSLETFERQAADFVAQHPIHIDYVRLGHLRNEFEQESSANRVLRKFPPSPRPPSNGTPLSWRQQPPPPPHMFTTKTMTNCRHTAAMPPAPQVSLPSEPIADDHSMPNGGHSPLKWRPPPRTKTTTTTTTTTIGDFQIVTNRKKKRGSKHDEPLVWAINKN